MMRNQSRDGASANFSRLYSLPQHCKGLAESRREESNDYWRNINRHAVVGTLAYPDWPVISHTSWNTRPSYGSPGAIGRNPVVDRKITRIEEVR